jgi:ribonuclease BN (tRNA processing enzyme)
MPKTKIEQMMNRSNDSTTESSAEERYYYTPKAPSETSYAKFWGTRGSIPVAGVDFLRYGGCTSCLEVKTATSRVLIDAGSGIRLIGDQIIEENKERDVHLFVGHTHWDHILGFPFFAPAYHSEYTVNIYGAKSGRKTLEELFSGMLDPDYFPVRLEEMQGKLKFHGLTPPQVTQIGDIKVHSMYANHPGSTLCFKIEGPNRTIGYCTDNEILVGYHGHPMKIEEENPLLKPYKGMIEFFRGCDVLIHEAQYSPQTYQKRVSWGHSSISNAAVLMRFAGIKEWVVTHHDPSQTDPMLLQHLKTAQAIVKEMGIPCRVHMAFDGLTIPI